MTASWKLKVRIEDELRKDNLGSEDLVNLTIAHRLLTLPDEAFAKALQNLRVRL